MRKRSAVWAAVGVVVLVAAAFVPTRLYLVRKGYLKYNEWDRRDRGQLKEGRPAPDVTLARYEGGTVQISRLWGERPLFLVFGSCT